jgi:hypothetical protein
MLKRWDDAHVGLRMFAMPGIARLAVSAIAEGHRRRGFRRGNLDVTNRNKNVPPPRNKNVPPPSSLALATSLTGLSGAIGPAPIFIGALSD